MVLRAIHDADDASALRCHCGRWAVSAACRATFGGGLGHGAAPAVTKPSEHARAAAQLEAGGHGRLPHQRDLLRAVGHTQPGVVDVRGRRRLREWQAAKMDQARADPQLGATKGGREAHGLLLDQLAVRLLQRHTDHSDELPAHTAGDDVSGEVRLQTHP